MCVEDWTSTPTGARSHFAIQQRSIPVEAFNLEVTPFQDLTKAKSVISDYGREPRITIEKASKPRDSLALLQ